jgi:DNA-binding winged helix-turn-helix (wHTH) protein
MMCSEYETMNSVVKAFGEYTLHARERLLERNGVPVALGGRSLDILIALVERAPDVVDKRELFARIWPNRVVEESNLRGQVSALRKALGAGHPGCRYITNVAGRGYCFVAPVSEIAQESGRRPSAWPATPDPMIIRALWIAIGGLSEPRSSR